MRLQDSPFRPGWWGTDLAEVGLREVRPWAEPTDVTTSPLCLRYRIISAALSIGYPKPGFTRTTLVGSDRKKTLQRSFNCNRLVSSKTSDCRRRSQSSSARHRSNNEYAPTLIAFWTFAPVSW